MEALPSFRVDALRCRRDGICAAVCPVRIISTTADGLPLVKPEKVERCIQCGHCMAFCPIQACAAPYLSVDGVRYLHKDLYPAPEQMEELVFARRSIRNFRNKPLPRELFLRILDAVRFAPTGHNRQSLRWIVTSGRGDTVRVAEAVVDWFRQLPETDPDLAEKSHASGIVRQWDSGVDIIARGAPHLAVVAGTGATRVEIFDAGAALTYFEMIALTHGVGCCWGGFVSHALMHEAGGAVREALGIGDTEKGYSAQLCGYAVHAAISRPERKALRVTWI